MSKNTIKLNVTVDHKRFYNPESMWGVYGMLPNTNKEEIETLDERGVFAVTGNTPELVVGEDYDIEITPSYNKKYGKGYEFFMVAAKRPKTVKEQQEYLKLMVTERQYSEIIKVYPDHLILDLMENDEFDYTDMKGIGETTYYRIRNYVFENLDIQEALVELKDLEITFNAMKKLVDHFGSAQSVVEKASNNIYELCEVSGFGFRKIDDYAMNRGDDPTNENRIVASIIYVLEQDADRGHSWMKRSDLISELVKLLNIDDRYFTDALDTLKDSEVKKIYQEENKVSLYSNYYYELKIKEKLYFMMEQKCKTKDVNIEDKIKTLEVYNGFTYTSEQKLAIEKAIINNVLVINGKGGVGKCVRGDTLIFTEKGMLEIQDIPNHFEVGDDSSSEAKVVSYDTKGKKYLKTTSHWFNMGMSDTYRIETSQGFEIEGTPEHPLLVLNSEGNLEYKKIDEISEGDFISISKNNDLWANGKKVNNNISYIMGVLTGDGSLTDSSTEEYIISYTNKNKEVYENTNKLIEKEFDSIVFTRRDKNTYAHATYSRVVYEQLMGYGLSMDYSYNKFIPKTVLESDKEVNIAFLQGLFDTDGHFSLKRGFEYCTASKKMAKQVHMILLNLGIVSRLKSRKNNQRKFNHYGNTYYYIYITGEDLKTFHSYKLFRYNEEHKNSLEERMIKGNWNTNLHVLHNNQKTIQLFHKELLKEDWYCKKNGYKIKLKNGGYSNCIQGSMDKRGRNISSSNILKVIESYEFENEYVDYIKNIAENLFFDKVISKKESKSVVYDFTVPETHSFVANGIVSHNTAIVKGIVEALQGYSYMSCSLSGKAAQVLSKQGLEARTIHRMLGVNHTGGFIYNKHNPLPYDIVILDEASMANNYLIYSIIVALKDSAKLIMVGDNGQLPSIGTGAVFDDLLSTDVLPRQELTIVHRQAQKSGILSAANEIREGKQINSSHSEETEIYGELEDMVLIPTDGDTDIKQMVLDIAERNKHRGISEFQVITGRVDSGELSVKSLNMELQKVFNDINQPSVSRSGYDYRIGDKVIQNGNNYEAPVKVDPNSAFLEEYYEDEEEDETVEVFNGTIGKIVDIRFDNNSSKKDHKIHIQFEDVSEIVEYSVNDLQQISLAYAITTHRSQGSTINFVVFAFDYSSYMLLSKEFVYTGMTRASEGCIMIVENKALHHAIRISAGGNRRTFLKEFLLNE